MISKICSTCKESKTLDQFSKDKNAPDGHQRYCKACDNARKATYHAKNRDQINAKAAAYHADNREQIKAKQATYNAEHRNEAAAYRAEHREQAKARNNAYNAEHRDERAAYNAEHREQIKAKQAVYSQTSKGKYASYKGGAKARAISFDLTFDQFDTYWQADCNYCGDQIATIGIDRVDSNVGYTIENCVPCCTRCNIIKMDYDMEETNMHMLKMLKHQGII